MMAQPGRTHVDRHGRLCGQWNLFDVFAGVLAAALVAPTFIYGAKLLYAWTTEIAIMDVTPRTFGAGEPSEITITGRNLGGIAHVQFGPEVTARVRRVDQSRLTVTVPPDLRPGVYSITLRGRSDQTIPLSESVLIERREPVIPHVLVTDNPALKAADAIRILSPPVTYDDVPIVVLCKVRRVSGAINGLPNPERGFDVERRTDLKFVTTLPGQDQRLMSVRFKAQLVVHGDRTDFFAPGGEPLTIGKRLYLKERGLQAIVASTPVILEEPSYSVFDVAP